MPNSDNIQRKRHHKNAIDAKYTVVRSLFMHPMSESLHVLEQMATVQAVRILNNLYGNDACFSFELENGFTKPVLFEGSHKHPKDLRRVDD